MGVERVFKEHSSFCFKKRRRAQQFPDPKLICFWQILIASPPIVY
jgi:hypothetical protein